MTRNASSMALLALDAVKDATNADIGHVAVCAALFGVFLHHSILRPFEVEQFMYKLITCFFLLTGGLFCVHLLNDASVLRAAFRSAVALGSLLGGTLFSMVVYRLFFHRLCKFPGPWGAKVSKFYSASLAAKDVQYHKSLARMHEQYGDFIRTVLNTYTPRVTAKVDDFIAQIAKQGIVDATAWTSYLSFDIMGDVGLGKDFAGVVSGREHPAIKAIHDHMTVLSIGGHVPWLLNLASRIPGCTAGYAPFFNWCAAELQAKQKTWKSDKQPTDIVSWLIKAQDENDPTAPPSQAALHEDSRVIIVAGSETTATTLAAIIFYLATQPRVYRKLQEYVDAVMAPSSLLECGDDDNNNTNNWTYEKAKSITYIDDIIHETLRLKPALLAGSYRVTPPEGLQIDEVHVPGDTTVFVPTQQIQTDTRYWGPRAAEFVPERFSQQQQQEDHAPSTSASASVATDTTTIEGSSGPFLPFTLGMHACPGKNLALMSLRISVSKIAQNFDLSLAPGEDGKLFDNAALETFTTTLPPLRVQFSKRV